MSGMHRLKHKGLDTTFHYKILKHSVFPEAIVCAKDQQSICLSDASVHSYTKYSEG